jgi:light-harvesting complex 1 beta chain
MSTNDNAGSATGLTEAEAKDVNGWFIKGTVVYIGFAIVAHILMWVWRPWIATGAGHSSLMEIGQNIATVMVG